MLEAQVIEGDHSNKNSWKREDLGKKDIWNNDEGSIGDLPQYVLWLVNLARLTSHVPTCLATFRSMEKAGNLSIRG